MKKIIFGSVLDSRKKPMENVLVTDGRNVVKTDEEGKYQLKKWKKSRFVYITVPSGYTAENFYFPLDKDRSEYDFTLIYLDKKEKKEHCFIQISDTEIGKDGTGEWLDFVREAVKKYRPDFLIHTGDICYEDGLRQHIKDMNTETMGCPVLYVIGNHDYVSGKYGEELYESLYGPCWYSFDAGNIHYCATPIQQGDRRSGYSSSDRWKWLKNDLEAGDKNKQLVIFNHTKSPYPDYEIPVGFHRFDLKKHNLRAWVFGHYHYNYLDCTYGVLNISTARPDSGGIDSSAAGLRVVKISDEGTVTTKAVYYGIHSSASGASAEVKLQGHCLFTDTLYENGIVYTATVSDDWPQNCGIYAVDTEKNQIKWEYKTENSVKNNIVIYNDSVIGMDAAGIVYSVDKENGRLIWKTVLELNPSSLGTSSGITVYEDGVYCGNSSKIYVLDADNGNFLHCIDRNKGENSPAEFVADYGRLLISSHWDALAGVDLRTGGEIWKNTENDMRFRSSTPVFIDENNILVADNDAIMTVDSKTGRIKHKFKDKAYLFSSSGKPAIKGKTAYIPAADNGLVCYDTESHRIKWQCRVGENILFTAPYTGKGTGTVESSPVTDGDSVIFGSNDGNIYRCDCETGEIIKKYKAGSAVCGKTAVTESKIYASTFDGSVLCFEK